ncbi:hypothetical protein [Roseinatronobacter sp.]|uniref:hypothetical protein n=1 Tax=Roseinatronobacter sp. TaxID=1945755 RepID=UPI0025DABF3F|nr:hypothetical protein [Roseibaca sp.]
MWCPLGFANFLEIKKAIRMILRSEEAYEKIHEIVYWRFDDSLPYWKQLEAANKSLTIECFREFFFTCPSLSVFSDAGVSLRISPKVSEIIVFPQAKMDFAFIDPETGIISKEHLKKIEAAAMPTVLDMRSRIDEIDSDNEAYQDYCEITKIEDALETWENISNFEGWAVGCSMSDIEMLPTDFMCFDLTGPPRGLMLQQPDSFAPKCPNLKQAIIEAFDKGEIRSKQALWKELFSDESREAFRAAWAEAAEERPEISKRGPKRLNLNN